MYISTIPTMRGRDNQGAGYYRASRGSRKHNGVDFITNPHQAITAFIGGTVTKLGYAYADDLSYRYIELRLHNGHHCRYFYVAPSCKVGDAIADGGTIGYSQDLRTRYPGITPHYHFEVFSGFNPRKRPKGYINPLIFLAGDA